MDFSRQSELIDIELFNHKKEPIHVIGCGATGSWVATQLAKMGFDDIHLYDADVIEIHNLPNQMFSIEQIGMNKAEALANNLKTYGTKSVTAHPVMVGVLNAPKTGYVFVLTDTVKSRKQIFEALAIQPDIRGIIETRMSLDTIQVYSVENDLGAFNRYRLSMGSETFNDETVTVSACGISQTIATTAAVTAAIAVRQLINFINGKTIYPEIHMSMGTFQLLAID